MQKHDRVREGARTYARPTLHRRGRIEKVTRGTRLVITDGRRDQN